METFGLYAGLESAMSQLVFEIVGFGEELFDAIDEQLLGADDEDFVQPFFFEFTQRHAVFFEEFDQVLAGDAAVLAAWDAVTTQPAGVKPFTHRPRSDLTDLRDLAGGKDFFHGRHSTIMFWVVVPVRAGDRPRGGPRLPGDAGRGGASCRGLAPCGPVRRLPAHACRRPAAFGLAGEPSVRANAPRFLVYIGNSRPQDEKKPIP